MEPWLVVVISFVGCAAMLSPWLLRRSVPITVSTTVNGRSTVRTSTRGMGVVKVIVGTLDALLLLAAGIITLFGLGVLNLPEGFTSDGKAVAIGILAIILVLALIALAICLVYWARNRARGESRWVRVQCRVAAQPPYQDRETRTTMYPYRISYPVEGRWHTFEYASNNAIPDPEDHYRWLDLTRPEREPVDSGDQPPRRGWWSRNLLWFVPLMPVIGILIPIIILALV